MNQKYTHEKTNEFKFNLFFKQSLSLDSAVWSCTVLYYFNILECLQTPNILIFNFQFPVFPILPHASQHYDRICTIYPSNNHHIKVFWNLIHSINPWLRLDPILVRVNGNGWVVCEPTIAASTEQWFMITTRIRSTASSSQHAVIIVSYKYSFFWNSTQTLHLIFVPLESIGIPATTYGTVLAVCNNSMEWYGMVWYGMNIISWNETSFVFKRQKTKDSILNFGGDDCLDRNVVIESVRRTERQMAWQTVRSYHFTASEFQWELSRRKSHLPDFWHLSSHPFISYHFIHWTLNTEPKRQKAKGERLQSHI